MRHFLNVYNPLWNVNMSPTYSINRYSTRKCKYETYYKNCFYVIINPKYIYGEFFDLYIFEKESYNDKWYISVPPFWLLFMCQKFIFYQDPMASLSIGLSLLIIKYCPTYYLKKNIDLVFCHVIHAYTDSRLKKIVR